MAAAPSPRAEILHTPHLAVVGHDGMGRHRLRRVANRAEADLALINDFLGGADVPSLRIHVYPSIESKGLATGYTMPAHAFPTRGEVHAADEHGFDGELTSEIATILLRHHLGKPRVEALEMGLAAVLADDWRGRGALYWAGRLAALEDLHDIPSLVDNRWLHRQSDLLARPIAAALVSLLVSRWGKAEFLARYASWHPDDGEMATLGTHFGTHLRSLSERLAGGAREVSLPAFQRGFCHAHEGYQIHNGYASGRSDAALERLAALGTNAVSITPFTYMRAPDRPSPLPFSSAAGSENDESVIHATLTAKRLGMVVMLKPHVWLSGGWPGQIEMTSESDWAEFFDHYYRWIRHYALMAEMYDVEILCVGVELSRTSVSQAHRWRELIRRLRTVYRGALTYAANWGEEFETTTLWSELDYIGVNCYYPLSDSQQPTDDELTRGVNAALDRIVAVGDRYDTPVLITEVGFTSAPAPWIAPHERRRGVVVDPDAQARCYEAFFRGLVGRARCAGVYWWKWPSFLEYGGRRHAGFTPNGKPAENVVRRWYVEILTD
jgi:hypothetical protein